MNKWRTSLERDIAIEELVASFRNENAVTRYIWAQMKRSARRIAERFHLRTSDAYNGLYSFESYLDSVCMAYHKEWAKVFDRYADVFLQRYDNRHIVESICENYGIRTDRCTKQLGSDKYYKPYHEPDWQVLLKYDWQVKAVLAYDYISYKTGRLHTDILHIQTAHLKRG